MAKRGAERELNQDNWQEEDEEEEAGHFKVASAEDLSKRRIIKAKRRVNSSENKGSGVFQGFSAFSGLTNSQKSSLPVMSSMKPFTGFANATSGVQATSSVTSTSTVSLSAMSRKVDNQNGAATFASENSRGVKGVTSNEYNDNIKALNESVVAWIEKHIKLNPYVDLTPIFNDYKEHMKNIDQKFSTVPMASSASSSLSDEANGMRQNSSINVSLPSVSLVSAQPSPPVFTGFSSQPQPCGRKEDVGDKEQNEGSDVKTEESEPGTSGDAEDPVPKPERVVTPEQGAFFSTRCKLFFKGDTSWRELGLGMLNLKKLDGKTQVLVRNDTTLGKILLNVYLSQSTPITKSSKNVMLVSVPNPPLYAKSIEGDNSKPATYLIKVKTVEDAEELYTQMDSNKSSSP